MVYKIFDGSNIPFAISKRDIFAYNINTLLKAIEIKKKL